MLRKSNFFKMGCVSVYVSVRSVQSVKLFDPFVGAIHESSLLMDEVSE